MWVAEGRVEWYKCGVGGSGVVCVCLGGFGLVRLGLGLEGLGFGIIWIV